MRQCWSAQEWLDAHPACIALWRVPGVQLPLTLQYDVMHCKYLGSDAYVAGSIMEYLVSHKLQGTKADNLQTIWDAIVASYAALKTTSRFGSMTLSMFEANKSPFPCLKGKASEVKHFIPSLLAVCRDFLDQSIHIERVMIFALESSYAIDRCLAENKHQPRCSGETWVFWCGFGFPCTRMCSSKFLVIARMSSAHSFDSYGGPHTPHMHAPRFQGRVLALFKKAINQYNMAITELGLRLHRTPGSTSRLFNFTVKNHCLEHVGEDACNLNPSWSWTFVGEDFLMKVRKLVQASAHGSRPMLVQRKVLGRYAQAMEMRLHGWEEKRSLVAWLLGLLIQV